MTHPAVDSFFSQLKNWIPEMEELRSIVLDSGLVEELKWKQPCYTENGKNVIILSVFKDHCVISFLKGSLLSDTQKLLVSPGENSQSVRFLKFTDIATIKQLKPIISTYIYEAIEIEKLGLKVEKTSEIKLVEELVLKMEENPEFKQAFESLTPGRQRAYNLFFENTKNPSTRFARIEKFRPRILNGKGMNDCVCGHSKKMPNCDGSHKYL